MSKDEIIQVKGQHYVLATSALADDEDRVLKHGDTLGVFNRLGDIRPIGMGEEGLYYQGTRFLSRFELTLGLKHRPMLLGSNIKSDNSCLSVDLTNPDGFSGDKLIVPRGTIHIQRRKILWEGNCYEEFAFHNLGIKTLDLTFFLIWDADFKDIFEVRGEKRKKRGTRHDPVLRDNSIEIRYDGLDQVVRYTRLHFSSLPMLLSADRAEFLLSLKAGESQNTYVNISCTDANKTEPSREVFYAINNLVSKNLRIDPDRQCSITSDCEQFNNWLSRSAADLQMMLSETEHGLYPYGGIPWYSTVFGRDGIISALQVLWTNSEIAAGVLTYLANTQATKREDHRDSVPGKILHEARQGEMAALKEIPFDRYYGSVDSTPLFVVLAGKYLKRTGDIILIEKIWPNIEAALEWIDLYGDEDKDGFIEYTRHCKNGLSNQGWKDSDDSVFNSIGELAEGHIALCEAQGYAYDAKRQAAYLCRHLGKNSKAKELDSAADRLKSDFNKKFWMPERKGFALALDKDKKQCDVLASNMGHALYSGIASAEYAEEVSELLLKEKFFSGWGIRTVAAGEARYNPMSYHNGTIWPHDNSLIASGLSRYGHKKKVLKLFKAIFDVARHAAFSRLPELWCGFDRQNDLGPTNYPVACSPQSWSAAAVFLLLESALGIEIDACNNSVILNNPVLPPELNQLRISNLNVGQSTVDLFFTSRDGDYGINVRKLRGDCQIIIKTNL
jgi:glycogen debranching enzyme